MTPAKGGDTTTAWGISWRMGYRSHNADRSKRGLLNILPRTILGFPLRGRLNERFLPRIQKLSPLCTTSLSLPPPVAPVPWGVSGGGAALSPGFSLHLCPLSKHGAHFAAQPPERSFFFPLFLSAEKEKEVIGGDAVVKSLSGFVSATEIDRLRQSLSVFLSPEKEKREKRKSCKGDTPLTPAEGSDITTA